MTATINLIDYTQDAVDKLIYTKSTRLKQGADTRNQIAAMTEEQKLEELAYMAKTIPSSWEFVTYTFELRQVTRAFTHQLVRTRTASFAQQTQRMLEMGNFTYYSPPGVQIDNETYQIYKDTMADIQEGYDKLIKRGVKPEDARGVLPTNIHTNIIGQFSLRTLSEMAKSRTGGRTQGEYQYVFRNMCDRVLNVHPWAKLFLFPDKWERLQELERFFERACANNTELDISIAMKILDQLKKETQV